AYRDRERADAIAKVENAIQQLDATRKALAEAETPLNDVQRKLAGLYRRTGKLILGVLAEEANDALDTLEVVRGDAAAADAGVRGLIRMLKERAQELQRKDAGPETAAVLFRVVEQINGKLDKLRPAAPTNAEIGDEIERW